MAYAIELTTNGKLDTDKVIRKMNTLSDTGSVSQAFEYGRELIGFDLAEVWRMTKLNIK